MGRPMREYAPPVVQVCAKIPASINEALERRAVAYGSSKAKIIRDILTDYVSNDKRGKFRRNKCKQ